MAPVSSLLAFGLLAINGALAHPGHNVQQEAAERGEWLRTRQPRSVRSCANQLRRRGHLDAALARRQQLSTHARIKRSLPAAKPLVRRDYTSALNISHASDLDVGLGSDETLLFADDSSCLLQPEVTQGPYYIDGELMRSDITEGQAGVPLYLDIQVIDTSTCEPVPALYTDLWHCNATGVYSGVVADGNGVGSDDTTNLDNTFLRGIQQTNSNGVVQFETVVPGHYEGRATHIHVLTHNSNSTVVRTNGTLLEGYGNFSTQASHVGQIFFDQDLLSLVSETAPYNTNDATWTLNTEDSVAAEEMASMDPFAEYVLLNPDNVADGVLAWISIGIDPTADTEVTSAGTHYEAYNVANENSNIGPGAGGAGGALSGGAPSGAVPTGAAPTGTA